MSSDIPASEFVTDTMGIVLRIERRKVGAQAKPLFEAAEAGTVIIHVPALVLAEILYLSEKRRISISPRSVVSYFEQFPNYKESPMSFVVVQSAAEITDVPELHDRLIAGTARTLNLSLITNDPIIQASTFVRTVW